MVTKKEHGYEESRQALTEKERRFVEEYLTHCNAAKAARRAGYSGHSAKQIGHENLTKPDLAVAVQAGLTALAERCELDADKLVMELAAIASSNIEHYRIDEEGYVVLEEGAPPEAIRAIQSVERIRTTDAEGNVTIKTKYRLWDKLKAVELLGKKLKLWVDKLEVDDPQAQAYRELLNQLKEGKAGDHK